jgi:serine/threonine protein kinase
MTEAFYRTGQLHILLEFMDMDLEHLLKKFKRIPENILALIIGQVLQALDFLHRKKKIIHRVKEEIINELGFKTCKYFE